MKESKVSEIKIGYWKFPSERNAFNHLMNNLSIDCREIKAAGVKLLPHNIQQLQYYVDLLKELAELLPKEEQQ
jgi:hypothetical protein